ncbi:c-type cytochrome [Sulfurospirillum multivorans]|uniref:Cytochrome c family protein n=2 Tax=Sulfurospirillum multivorans TaxID=66821 RepID=A0AA86AJD6_SULMK|nr:c-type cytochrome [Sulfurospirillum multivorans]AHJ11619.1 cytochrome c family protein [Sulfurospirillum multivorans DSM 12446]QEH05119.1 cytochrome c family protein [Sulfurospirillum multivorans]
MKKVSILGTALLFLGASGLFAFDVGELAKRSDHGFKPVVVKDWQAPDEKTIPNNMFGEYVRYGKALVQETYKYIGPEVNDPKMRYAGNNLSCNNCHLDAGTKKYSAGFMGVFANFPQYRPRENTIGNIEERINGCMQRSMNGKPLPENSKEMKAMVSYMYWLGQGVPIGAKVEGVSLVKVDRKIIMSRAADPIAGEKVYKEMCASCHGDNGQGVKREGKAMGYEFPPLWGKDTYNTGAGMFRLIKSADWIVANMPLGATSDARILSDDQAYDVAAYMNNYDKERPIKANKEKDFPDAVVRAADSDIGPYNDDKNRHQHKFGPYKGIIIPAK